MQSFVDHLATLTPKAILDVATGKGTFLELLTSNLKRFERAVGVDIDPSAVETASDAFKADDRISIQHITDSRLPFGDDSFDMVTMSNALHHLEDETGVLGEMKRVCRPGGVMIIQEMYRETTCEAQETFHIYHDLVCEMRRFGGHSFNAVYKRDDIISLMDRFGFENLFLTDHADDYKPTSESEKLELLRQSLADALSNAQGDPLFDQFQSRVNDLTQRLSTVGCQRPNHLIYVGALAA